MAGVIKDFLKFEIDFKREYFGINIKQSEIEIVKKDGLKRTGSTIF
jgi:hypothetical protein